MSDDATHDGGMDDDAVHDGAGALDDLRLRALAAGYHRPPPTPRDAMWAAVRARIAEGRGDAVEETVTRARTGTAAPPAAPRDAVVLPIGAARARRRSLPWLGAAAAMVALGFALGRFTGPRLGPAPAATPVAAPASAEEVFRTAAARHLERSEELLTLVRSDARAGRVDRRIGEWGESLLVETRLLLDSPAGADPELEPVLEDLELLLAQVALLAHAGVEGGRGREELRLIAEGMDARDMLPRIQAVLPATTGS